MIQANSNMNLQSWDLQGNRQSSEDVPIADLIGRSATVRGICSTPDRVGIMVDDNVETKVYVLDRAFNRIPGEDFNLPAGNWYSLGWLEADQQWLCGHPDVRRILRFTKSGSEVSGAALTLPGTAGFGSFWGFGVTADRVYATHNVTAGGGGIVSFMHDGSRVTSEDKTFSTGSWTGATSIENRLCVYISGTNAIRFFDLPNLNSASGGFTLPAGTYPFTSFFALNAADYVGN